MTAANRIAGNALLRAAGALWLSLCATPGQAAPPPPESFARLPAIDLVRLSPNGQLLAWASHSDQGTVISLYSLATGKVLRRMEPDTAEGLKLRDLDWSDDETLLATLSVTRSGRADAYSRRTHEFFRTLAIDTRGDPVRTLLMEGGDRRYVTSASDVLLLHTGKPQTVIMSSFDYIGAADRQGNDSRISGGRKDSGIVHSLFEVDTRTGDGKRLEGGTPFTDAWFVDSQGRAVAYSEWRADTREYRVRVRDGGGWKALREPADWNDLRPAALSADGLALVAIGARGGARERAWRVPLDGGEITALSLEDADVQNVVVDRFTGTVAGLQLGGLEPTVQWLDPKLAGIQGSVSKAFPGRQVTIYDRAQDFSKVLVRVEAADNPPVYFLVDLSKGTADTIGEAYPELAGMSLGKRESMSYAARDGLEIPAYLTLPPGLAPERLPLVVFPHGGPWSRDDSGFDWWAQFLATRGYAVLQPQFRGSVGFGAELQRAGKRAWGQAMQDDLLDGIDALEKRGLVDSQRVCIVGASYGGYAALAGAARSPDRFACAASINGVSDLSSFFSYLRTRHGDESDALASWKSLVGIPYSENVGEISPISSAADIRAPVLLMHGTSDVVVPIAQSEGIARALERSGKTPEFIRLQGEDHWLSQASSRIAVLRALETFLARYLGEPG